MTPTGPTGGQGDGQVHGPRRPGRRAPTRRAGNPRRSRSPGCAPTTEVSLARLIRPTTRYRPDIEALRAAPTRIAVAAGATSAGWPATAVPWRSRTGSARRWSGDHGGFMALPEQFGRVLDQVLTQQ